MVKFDLESVLKQTGLDNVSGQLTASFGEDVVDRSMKQYGEGIDASQQRGELKMAAGSGLLNSTIGTRVPKNTWYGD